MSRAVVVTGHDLRRWVLVNARALAVAGMVLVLGSAVAVGAGVFTDTLLGPSPGLADPSAPRDDQWQPIAPEATFACTEPLTVLHNPMGAPADVEPDLVRAVDAIAMATNRAIGYGGPTTAGRGLDVAGSGGATIVIRWVPDVTDLVGASSPTSVAVGGATRIGSRLVAGDVVLVANAVPPAGSGPGELEVLLRHELAHAVGIDQHSTDPADVLYPYLLTDKEPSWGPGDLVALAAVGCPA